MRPLAVLRPEPGNAATCARIAAAGGTALALPLFAVRALAWEAPASEQFDAVFLTSANAVRHSGVGLARYRNLPVFAVGEATADAARGAGFTVAAVGSSDGPVLAALARDHGVTWALHLAGRERAYDQLTGVATTIAVYASEPCDVATGDVDAITGSVALIHSPRAGARLAELVRDRSAIRLAAISDAALTAAGHGWAASIVADRPDDDALITAAFTLAD